MKQRRAQGAIRWILISAAVIAAGMIALGVLWLNRPHVTVTRVVEGPVVSAFYATGTVEPAREYPIKTSNAGIVTDVLVDKGDAVHVGQKLAVVEDPQLQFQLKKAEANLKQATERADPAQSPVLKEYAAKIDANAAMLENAKHELDRYTTMVATGGASKTDVDKAADHVKDMWSQGISLQAQRDAAKLQLEDDLAIATAAWRAAKTDVERQTLISPIDGVVLDRPAPLRTRLNVNVNDHVMQLADVRPGNLRMRAAVDEENIAEVKDGQLVQMVLYSFPGKTFEGKVTHRYPKADADRRTFEVDIQFTPANPDLFAGMTGELAFIIDKKDRALIAPAQALQGDALYTVRNGRLAKVDNAVVGIRSVERIELTKGFQLGDVIVISPVQDIAVGTPVRMTVMDPVAAAGMNKSSTALQRNPLGQ
ncbi:MAG TPA: efflux RND transporter periplasmic adaptor subunit [Tepidisphaeraceae bacterium]|jgi:HlyD family secretion protein|nr:efflux RND transporter periplasmic adaptor subunit [Tepidisphaeraceae bacterium]